MVVLFLYLHFREMGIGERRRIKTIDGTQEDLAHSVEKRKIYSHRKIFSSNQLFSNFVSKIVTFTKFLSKKSESEFPYFPHRVLIIFTLS